MANDLLVVSSLFKCFDGIAALADVSLRIPRGSITGIVGGNGAGKTTLFDIISGFETADSGDVWLDGEVVTGWPAERLARGRCGVVRSFQEVRIFPNLRVVDNVLAARQFSSGTSLIGILRRRSIRQEFSAHEETALAALRVTGLSAIAERTAGELSYGQKKLLEIARCLAAPQNLLMLDEPFAGVHRSLFDTICHALDFARAGGKTILLIEHDREVVEALCDRLIVLNAGRVLAGGDGTAGVISNAEAMPCR